MCRLKTYQQKTAVIEKVIDYLPSAIIVFDIDIKIVLANKAAEQLTNKSKKRLFGLRECEAFNCIHVEDDSKGYGRCESCKKCVIRNTIETTIQTKMNSVNIETPLEFVDKGKRVLAISTTWLSSHQLVIAAFNDITELKQQEEMNIENAELLAAIKSGGAVYHEMNQPLTVISGYIQLLEMGFIAREDWDFFITEMRDNLEKLHILSSRLMQLEQFKTIEYHKDDKLLDYN